MQSAQTQTEPQAPHPIHHPTAALPRKEIPWKAIPEHSRTSWILIFSSAHRDTGENLVPKSTSKGEASARGWIGENQNGRIGTWSARCPALHGLLPSQPDGWCYASWVERTEHERDTKRSMPDTAHTFIAEWRIERKTHIEKAAAHCAVRR